MRSRLSWQIMLKWTLLWNLKYLCIILRNRIKMTRIFVLFIFVYGFIGNVRGQDDRISWLNQNIIPLSTGSDTTFADLSFLSHELKNNKVIGLGEASHGTAEFYLQKGRIIRYLVEEQGYRLLIFEADGEVINNINKWAQGENGDLRTAMKPMVLYDVKEIASVFEWLRKYNRRRSAQDRVVLVGVDEKRLLGDPLGRDSVMAANCFKVLDKRKAILWGHNVHLFKNPGLFKGHKSLGCYLYDKLQKQYYMLGFDSYRGSATVLEDGEFAVQTFNAKSSSFSSMASQTNHRRFFVSFKDKSNPFSGTSIDITNIYANRTRMPSITIKPEIDLDGLIFVRETTPSAK